MKNYFWKYFIYLTVFLLLQYFVFDNIIIRIGSWYFVPYAYLLFFMLLPQETDNYTLLGLALLVGLIMDFIDGSLALQTASLLLVVYMRRAILQWVAPQLGYNQGMLPSYINYGMGWFLKYALIFTFIHHFFYYLLNNFSLVGILSIMGQTIINTLLTVTFIVILHYFFKNRPLNV